MDKDNRIFQAICFYVTYENHVHNHAEKIKKIKNKKLNSKIDCSETFTEFNKPVKPIMGGPKKTQLP